MTITAQQPSYDLVGEYQPGIVLAENLAYDTASEQLASSSEDHIYVDGLRHDLSTLPNAIAAMIEKRRWEVARTRGITIEAAGRLSVADINQLYFNIT